MNRRRILRWSVALGTMGITGCVADDGGGPGDGTTGTTATTSTASPEPSTTTSTATTATPPAIGNETRYERTTPPPEPSKPASLTPEAAVDYVQRLELRHAYDRLALDDLDRLALDCKTYLHRETPDGYVVLSGCGGSASGGNSHADRSGVPAFYHVTPDRTVRIAETNETRIPEDDAYAGPSGENLRTETGFRIYNFRSVESRFSVRIDHRESGERAYAAEHGLPAEGGVVVADAIRRRGTYDVTVRVAGTDTAATGAWSVTGRHDAGFDPLAVTLVDGPDLGIRRSEVGEVVRLGPV